MKRRNFIKFSIISGLILSTKPTIAKVFTNNDLQVIQELYNVIFPKTEKMPSASEFKATEYLSINISHKTFDNDDKEFLTQGIKDFKNSFPEFMKISYKQKAELVQNMIKDSSYARSFISRLSYYGIEAMFSDPIYGGNYNQLAWNSVNHYYGRPRPKVKYGQKYGI